MLSNFVSVAWKSEGDNFFKSVNYTLEVMCAEEFSVEKIKLRDVETRILAKRAELSKFETEYREVCHVSSRGSISYVFVSDIDSRAV